MDRQQFHPVDRLGSIRAEIAHLRTLEKVVEDEVRALVDPKSQVAEGELFRVALVVQFRESLIAEKVRELLHPNTLRAVTRVTEVHMLKVTARSTEKVPA